MLAARVIANFGDDRLPSRFWEKVQPCPISGCWIWTGATARADYGVFSVPRPASKPRKSRLEAGYINAVAHRVSYEAIVGEIPSGLFLDHLCRVTRCVNPAHLEPVTCQENTRRGLAGGLKTHCPSGHPYDDANTQRDSNGRRRCAACNREQVARWKADLKALGRSAFRAGITEPESSTFAASLLGRELTANARAQVLAGWRAERSEAAS